VIRNVLISLSNMSASGEQDVQELVASHIVEPADLSQDGRAGSYPQRVVVRDRDVMLGGLGFGQSHGEPVCRVTW
jgi:hypothetical protein